MGIESVSNVAGAYQAQSVKTKTESAKTVSAEAQVQAQMPEAVQQKMNAAAPSESNWSEDNSRSEDKESRQPAEGRLAEGKLADAANSINKQINRNTIAEFGYHEATRRITIKIKDKDTDKVIKEIPSEKALEMLEKAWELAGILVDERR